MIAKAALFSVVSQQLRGDALWGERVYHDAAPRGVAYPYVVFFVAGGGELNLHRTPDAEIVVSVKAVADNLAVAFECAARIQDLLNDRGASDIRAGLPDAPGGWLIISSTQGLDISLVDYVDQSDKRIYHEGAQYEFFMQKVGE